MTFVALAALPATAAAQDPAPAAPAAAAAATTRPAAAQAAALPGSMTLSVERIGGRRRVALTRDRVRIRGRVSAYVANETVVVRVYRGKRKVHIKQVELQPNPSGGGYFVLGFKPKRPGRLVVRAEHVATPALAGFSATSSAFQILPRRVAPGSGRTSVRALQNRLARLGYVVGRRGSYDARTGRAVLAFRKVTGMARTTSASKQVMRRIARGGGRFRIRFPSHGRHMEADITRQVLALIEGGKVRRIYPISSGKPSTPTVLGHFRVYSKTPGTNAKGMVHSAYFIRGYATHGYPSVPIYPASHGCLRVPIPDALSLFRWIRIGTPIDTYR
ncbi:MAG: L,D-transpeptidase family protein [Solirubrobacteraceae bacterium]